MDQCAKVVEPNGWNRRGKGDLWSVVGWQGSIRGPSSGKPVEILAKLFSDQYLDNQVIDTLLTLLSLRCRSDGGKSLIVGTTFADFICLLPPVIGGVPTGPIVSITSGQRYLKTYGTQFQNTDHHQLYTILYRPPKHWTSCLIDFSTKQIRYGDGLKWDRPQDFFEGLQAWTAKFEPNTVARSSA
ncbi:hypothetical protein K438DRAFT_1781520 [Mycena galopus ATCC 62051]|nr:hypothetical protein K438DRAFT_1781520 [Mycena galopus ATCC 62051]